MIAAFVTFFSNDPTGGIIATMCVVTCLLVITIFHRPCRDVVAVNLCRVVVYLLSLWSLVATLLARYAVADPATNYFPATFLFAGWEGIVLFALLLYCCRGGVARCTRGTCLQGLGRWLSDIEVLQLHCSLFPLCRWPFTSVVARSE